MDSEDLAANLHFIRCVEARMKEQLAGSWICMGLAAGVIYLDILSYASSVRPFAGRPLVVGQVPMVGWALVALLSIMVLTAAVISVLFWYNAMRGRERLTQLKAIASAMSSEEQPEVWPPPPKGPKG